ncbi:ATP-binding protein [Streptomyces sp. NPDC058045]|uniref:ATP-binding protein n=1 Tax=Streptomyces sp. NPDC058045 TaxID=3346311 RepID=UPI0036E67C98
MLESTAPTAPATATTPATATAAPTPVPGRAVAHQFPRHRRNVGRARETLRDQLAAWHVDGEVTDTAVLLLSELATNAVAAKAPRDREFRVRFELTGRELCLAVEDASDEKPAPRDAGPDDESGRGLALVSALADSWGVAPRTGVGKTVWARLLLPEVVPS